MEFDGPRLAMIGTYPPTECGLATFNLNLSRAIGTDREWSTHIVRVLEGADVDPTFELVTEWVVGDPFSLARAAGVANDADAVILQHEFGLFGGRDGDEVLDLVAALNVPLVVVMHTVLEAPTDHQRWIIDELTAAASVTVVLSQSAYDRMLMTYRTPTEKLTVIPHGADANFSGSLLSGVKGPSILTWGLLGPGKGLEYGINAVARLQRRAPRPTYIIAGETHPKVKLHEGERYRHQLEAQSRELGVANRVVFADGYRDAQSLRELIRSVDVVLLPYESRDQVSSGVLVEAIASGKPVVATRFPHAVELLSRGAGFVVDQGDATAMADALEEVLYVPGIAMRMRVAARQEASALLWPAVGAQYRSLLRALFAERASGIRR
ncbi:MAG: glycosyltransferase [Acidobacteria bacterium]|nr:glycosyltransferase [Acidobacteriota bacterium]